MESTKAIVDNIVDALKSELTGKNLPSFKCVYISGSYCRGDWLDNCSDLDVGIIYSDNIKSKQNDLDEIYRIIEKSKGGKILYSHTPDGIDYSFNENDYIPKTLDEASKPNPYPYFSTLMFDLKENHKTIYGIELNDLLPETPNPKKTAKDWLLALIRRMKKLDPKDIKLQYNTYKMVLALQLLFGKETINKYEILKLYQENVPRNKMKWFGQAVISNYVGSIFPERPAIIYDYKLYMDFIDEIKNIVNM
jgi:predicted nucleotidyltransferase